MVDFTSDTLSGDIRRCILKKKMDLGNIGGFRVPKKALLVVFSPFLGILRALNGAKLRFQVMRYLPNEVRQ